MLKSNIMGGGFGFCNNFAIKLKNKLIDLYPLLKSPY